MRLEDLQLKECFRGKERLLWVLWKEVDSMIKLQALHLVLMQRVEPVELGLGAVDSVSGYASKKRPLTRMLRRLRCFLYAEIMRTSEKMGFDLMVAVHLRFKWLWW